MSGSAQRSAKTTSSTRQSDRFSAEERAAMKERARELKAGRRPGNPDGEANLLAKIAEMPDADRAVAERVHAIVKASAPALTCRTWYGMPAYAKDGNVICFFRNAGKFKTRYATLGFSDKANLRRRYVADRLRGDGTDSSRRSPDRHARQNSGDLKTATVTAVINDIGVCA